MSVETVIKKVKQHKVIAVLGVIAVAIIVELFIDWDDVLDDGMGVFIGLACCLLAGVVAFMCWAFNRDCRKENGKGLLAYSSEKVRKLTLSDIKNWLNKSRRVVSDAIVDKAKCRMTAFLKAYDSTAKGMVLLLREPLPAMWGVVCGGGFAVGLFMLACHVVPYSWGVFGICIAFGLILFADVCFAYFLSACIALIVAVMGRRVDLRQMKAVLVVTTLVAVVPLGMFVKGCWRAGVEIHENAELRGGEVVVNWNPAKISHSVKDMGYFTGKGYVAAYRYTLSGFDERYDGADSDEKCRIDYKSNLTLAASRNSSPEIGVGYISLGGFEVIQYLPDDGAVLAKMEDNGLANLAAALSGNLANVSAKNELGSIIYVKTSRQYIDGQELAGGVYIYEGIVTYQTVYGGAKSVKAFREMDETLARKKIAEDKNRRIEDAVWNETP